jgi:hypothetical protein
VGIGVNQYLQNVRLMIGTSATSVLTVAAGSGCPQACTFVHVPSPYPKDVRLTTE